MQKLPLYCTTGLLVLLIAGLYSCKKVNGVNNGQVIETPFSLYYSDTAGTLYNTTDGINIHNLIFPPDGVSSHAICTAGPNILWIKDSTRWNQSIVLISTDNGKDFNHSYDSLKSFPDVSCNNFHIDLNQSMIINIPSWNNRTYTMSYAPGDATGRLNYLGLVHNDSLGLRGYWVLDTVYNHDSIGTLPVMMTSLTQLANGTLCGLAYDPDMIHVRNFYKKCADDATCSWMENTANPDAVPSIFQYNLTGTPLPPYLASPTQGYFSLGHFNNRLIAIDNKCSNGGWYSDDMGRNWKQFTGLPTNVPLLCVASPFEQVCLVGTDSAGLYMLDLNTNTFVPNNNGLGKYLKVRNIAFKENIYKNTTSKRYVYLATDQGIYQSTDGGHNWVMTIPGNFVTIY